MPRASRPESPDPPLAGERSQRWALPRLEAIHRRREACDIRRRRGAPLRAMKRNIPVQLLNEGIAMALGVYEKTAMRFEIGPRERGRPRFQRHERRGDGEPPLERLLPTIRLGGVDRSRPGTPGSSSLPCTRAARRKDSPAAHPHAVDSRISAECAPSKRSGRVSREPPSSSPASTVFATCSSSSGPGWRRMNRRDDARRRHGNDPDDQHPDGQQ